MQTQAALAGAGLSADRRPPERWNAVVEPQKLVAQQLEHIVAADEAVLLLGEVERPVGRTHAAVPADAGLVEDEPPIERKAALCFTKHAPRFFSRGLRGLEDASDHVCKMLVRESHAACHGVDAVLQRLVVRFE